MPTSSPGLYTFMNYVSHSYCISHLCVPTVSPLPRGALLPLPIAIAGAKEHVASSTDSCVKGVLGNNRPIDLARLWRGWASMWQGSRGTSYGDRAHSSGMVEERGLFSVLRYGDAI